MDVLVSVIIPYYNSAQYLGELLDSISMQYDIEVIVINDHSTKNIDEYNILQMKYANSNVVFLDNDKENKGAGSARNKGMQLACGKYLLFADADDTFLPGTWELIRNMELGADIIFFPPTSKNNNGCKGCRHEVYAKLARDYAREKSKRYETRLRWMYYSPCSKLVKKELVDTYHIEFDNTPVSNDNMFSILVGMNAKSIDAIDQEIYQIREHAEGLSNKRDIKSEIIRKKVYTKCYKLMKKNTSRKEKSDYLEYHIGSDLYYYKCYISVCLYELFFII